MIDRARRLLRKMAGRDFLILNPDLIVSEKSDDSIFITRKINSTQYLPIKYNYHTDRKWRITYEIRGTAKGTLSWELSTPKDGVFCKTDVPVTLPLILNIELRDDRLYFNGKTLPTVGGINLPLTAPLLSAQFSMTTDEGLTLRRRTAHRIQLGDAQTSDSDYYQGFVYEDYDSEAATVPGEIFDSLLNYLPPSGRFLEIGCATGLTVEYAATRGFIAEGIDVSEWAVEQANKRKGVRCRVLNFDEATPKDFEECYDVIVMHSVIEHLKHPERAMKLLFDLCCPGGIVYIQTLNANSLMHAVMKKDWGGYSDHTHESPWINSDWLDDAAREAGFEAVSMRHYHLWNDNVHDDVWNALNKAFRVFPLNVLLEDGYGDAVELILRRPVS